MTRREFFKFFKEGIVKGFFWSIGVTIGFAFVSTVLVYVVSNTGGLPVIGNWIANIVAATNSALINRNPLAN